MNESYTATCRMWAWLTWAATIALVILAWVVMFIDGGKHWHLAFLLGGTGCMLSAVAATLHIRSFAVRMCSLIRVANRRELERAGEESAGLHPVR